MTSPPAKTSSARLEWVTAALLTLAILWLHFFFWRHAGGLWRDEFNSVNLAQSRSLTMMTHDSFPVLVPGMMGAWSRLVFGGSDSELRFAGMFASMPVFASVTILAVIVSFIVFLWFSGVPARSQYFIPPLALMAARTEYFLMRHGGRSVPSWLPDDDRRNFQENVHLFMAEGWRD